MTTFQRNHLYRYRSAMGAIGAGFLIDFGGRTQHSVAWPDGPAQRFRTDELDELGIECWSTEANQPPESEASEPALAPPAPAPADPVGPDGQLEPPEWASDGEKPPAPEAEEPRFVFKPDDTEANNIREYLRTFPTAENQEVIGALHKLGTEVSSSQVSSARKQLAKIAENEATAQQAKSESEAAES